MHRLHKYECYYCRKVTNDVVEINVAGVRRYICRRCYLARLFHDSILSMLRDGNEDDLNYVLRVLRGINDLIEDNPQAQAIRYVIDVWSQKYPKPLYVDELESGWKYIIPFQKVLGYLVSEKIFRIEQTNFGREAILPGPLLEDLLKMFPSSRGFFRDVIRAVTGLVTVNYLSDPETRKFRKVYAILQAINVCIDDENKISYFEIKGYKCKLCEPVNQPIFASITEVKEHILNTHSIDCDLDEETCFNSCVEYVLGKEIAVWCKLLTFIEKASVFGVEISKFLRDLLTRGVILPPEGDEVVRDVGGEKYVAVDVAWFRIRERMRALERELRRGV